jgi:hypothetical protein
MPVLLLPKNPRVWLLALALLVGAAGAPWLSRPRSSLKAKYDRIQRGMTFAEVQQIMGREPTARGPDLIMPEVEDVAVWEEEDYWIAVGSNRDRPEEVTAKHWQQPYRPTWWEWLRARLGR